ncbi:8-oxo-dGDP phosphatase NUDT18-like [Lineus longissimus]|uniref:8-oxo-dGDP phosphatase NUDT18-like n=1 Tax=Lineus longissimus TaxID=88925 RepID=UPI002B4EFCD1
MASNTLSEHSSDTVGDFTAVEADLGSLLAGRIPLKTAHCLVDVTSQSQDEFHPITKHSVCYIVAGIVINDAGDVLFMQEAKESCRGKWYLPAGRMEPDETIIEGAKREVLEETGLEFEPDTLLCVEIGTCTWFRFTFIGHVTGGRLKTLADSDGESLQARWMSKVDLSNSKAYPLRAPDVMRLVMLAQNYRSRHANVRHPPLLPVINGHQQLLMRLVITNKSGDDAFVLMNTRDVPHFPSMVLNPFIHRSMKDCFIEVLKQPFGTPTDSDNLDVVGLLSIEHHGKPQAVNDGFGITFLLSFPDNGILPKICHKAEETYSWHKLAESELKNNLMKRLIPGMCVPAIL